MTVQKKILDLTGSQYLVQKVKSAINDVDSSLSAHIADTDIHVTTADKTTWNTVTSKANDNDVVHKSGDETVGGVKTFSDLQIISYGTRYKGSRDAYILPEFSAGYSGLAITTLSFVQTVKIGNFVLDANNKPSLDTSKGYIQIATGENNNVNACVLEARNSTSSSLGTSSNRWSKIYGNEYYYGSNNVEFSTKFVTTDTAQTISGNKTFSSINGVEPSSLSLPSDRSARIDISSYFTNTGTGDTNTYTVPANGYIYMEVNDCVSLYMYSQTTGKLSNYGNSVCRNTIGKLVGFLPVRKNDEFVSQWYTTATNVTLTSAYFIPCQGNV